MTGCMRTGGWGGSIQPQLPETVLHFSSLPALGPALPSCQCLRPALALALLVRFVTAMLTS